MIRLINRNSLDMELIFLVKYWDVVAQLKIEREIIG